MTNTVVQREKNLEGKREKERKEEMTGNARSSCFRAFSEFCREALRGPPLVLFFQRLASSSFASSFPFPRKKRAYKGHWPDSHAEDPRPSSSHPNENPAFSRKKLQTLKKRSLDPFGFRPVDFVRDVCELLRNSLGVSTERNPIRSRLIVGKENRKSEGKLERVG